jgi:site-specific DNA-methyltransferase (adenine-specific)
MSGGGKHKPGSKGGMFGAIDCEHTARGDSGGASRFFYCPKASRAERDAGLEWFEPSAPVHGYATLPDKRMDREQVRNNPRNVHPTVKPLALARYLARLILPPIPDARMVTPFSGSGSEVIGALQAGWSHVDGIDSWDVAARISRARIEHWSSK